MATEIIIVATGDIFNFSYKTSTTESPRFYISILDFEKYSKWIFKNYLYIIF